jgi:hypothetical protein
MTPLGMSHVLREYQPNADISRPANPGTGNATVKPSSLSVRNQLDQVRQLMELVRAPRSGLSVRISTRKNQTENRGTIP